MGVCFVFLFSGYGSPSLAFIRASQQTFNPYGIKYVKQAAKKGRIKKKKQ